MKHTSIRTWLHVFSAVILSLLSTVYSRESFAQIEKESDETNESNGVDENKVRVGIVATKPDSGRYVETSQGFMVPYEVQIPGTDVTFEMVPVPGGKFKVGSPEGEVGRESDEGPQVEIEVAPFWIGKHEVTWAEYESFLVMHDVFKRFDRLKIRVVAEDEKKAFDVVTVPSTLYDPSFSYDAGRDKKSPAATMTQYAAKQYTKWLSLLAEDFYRLPTEIEWEYACRAGSTSAYSFGNDPSQLHEYAWFKDNSNEMRHVVGGKKPNSWGLHDMHGNVSEWVLDGHTLDGYADFVKKGTSATAVHWPTKVEHRVVRGGSFEMTASELRSASRLAADDVAWKDLDPEIPMSPYWYTTAPATGVGFRLFRPLELPVTQESKDRYWRGDVAELVENVESNIDQRNSGARGKVDKDLPKAVKESKGKLRETLD